MNGRPFQAVEIGSVTSMGCGRGPYPMSRGNCFDVIDGDGRGYKILNFGYENLKEALRRGTSDDPWAPGVAWPIACLALGDHSAVIHDPRIPTDWYMSEWCEVCCPESMLPVPQILRNRLREASGETQTTLSGGIIMTATQGKRIRLPDGPKP